MQLVPSTLPLLIWWRAGATMPSIWPSTSLANPGEMPVFRAAADLHDPLHRIAHALLLPVAVGSGEHLICDVAGKGQLVLGYELLVALPGPSPLQSLLLTEEGASP